MRRIVPVAVLVLAVLAGNARAEAGKKKNPGIAFILSFGGTFASWAGGGALVFASQDGPELGETAFVGGVAVFAVGPALGNVYNGEYERASATSALRAAGLLALIWAVDELDSHGDLEPCRCDLATAALITGGVAWVGSTIFDWIDAPLASQRHNAQLTVTPAPLPAKGGLAPGLVLAGSF